MKTSREAKAKRLLRQTWFYKIGNLENALNDPLKTQEEEKIPTRFLERFCFDIDTVAILSHNSHCSTFFPIVITQASHREKERKLLSSLFLSFTEGQCRSSP